MQYKSSMAYPLPFLDPALNPDHPLHHLPPVDPEDPYEPLTKRERARLRQAREQAALENYVPPHVLRSWEANTRRAKRRAEVLALRLSSGDYLPDGSPSPILIARREFEDRWTKYDSSSSRRQNSPYRSSQDPDHDDFRQFAVHSLRLGYHRFHLSTEDFGPSEDRVDPPTTPEPDVCWIMEYSDQECRVTRRQIAHIMGVYPAVMDSETTAYDAEQAWRYERRLHARCRRTSTRCIRPSHIELYTPAGLLIP